MTKQIKENPQNTVIIDRTNCLLCANNGSSPLVINNLEFSKFSSNSENNSKSSFFSFFGPETKVFWGTAPIGGLQLGAGIFHHNEEFDRCFRFRLNNLSSVCGRVVFAGRFSPISGATGSDGHFPWGLKKLTWDLIQLPWADYLLRSFTLATGGRS